jgi:taurine dioxygenase
VRCAASRWGLALGIGSPFSILLPLEDRLALECARYETINVTPVTPRIGAEVDGLTLAKPLSNRQVEELHQALAEHQVLFFRDQPLDVEGHKAFGRYFGDLHIHPNTPGPEGHPEILPIHADANSKRIAGEYWHSDVSCDEEPPLGSILYLHTVPPVGGLHRTNTTKKRVS